MIREIRNAKDRPGFTSDRWHVVHARWSGNSKGKPRFERAIVSEHPDRDSAVAAARALWSESQAETAGREPVARDQVFVRRPGFRTLEISGRVERRGPAGD